MELSILIQRCLTYGVKIYPYQLESVLQQYETYKVPDKDLQHYNGEQIEKYVRGLYLSNQEMSRDWREGFSLLQELGFEEQERSKSHRSFTTLIFKGNKR